MSELLANLGYWLRDLLGIKRPFPLNSTVVPFCTSSTDLVDKDFGGSFIILKTVSVTGNLKTGDSTIISYRPYGSTGMQTRIQNGLGSQYFDKKISSLKISPSFGGERYGYLTVVYEGISFQVASVGTSGMPINVVDLIETIKKITVITGVDLVSLIQKINEITTIGTVGSIEGSVDPYSLSSKTKVLDKLEFAYSGGNISTVKGYEGADLKFTLTFTWDAGSLTQIVRT